MKANLWSTCSPWGTFEGGGQGVRTKENNGQEVYGKQEKRGGGSKIPKVVGSGRNSKKLHSILLNTLR